MVVTFCYFIPVYIFCRVIGESILSGYLSSLVSTNFVTFRTFKGFKQPLKHFGACFLANCYSFSCSTIKDSFSMTFMFLLELKHTPGVFCLQYLSVPYGWRMLLCLFYQALPLGVLYGYE